MRRDVFQVVDELGQVFNGIDVVVRWRGDQAHTGHRITQKPDVLGHLGAGQLSTFARLGTLRHLDLDLVGAAEVFSGHAKAARGDLLDFGAQGVACLQGHIDFDLLVANHAFQGLTGFDGYAFELVAVTRGVFTALAGVAFAAYAVHGHRQGGVGFGRNRTQRHGAGGKALDDLAGRLDLVNRYGFGGVDFELEQAAQRHMAATLVVDDLCVFFVGAEVVGTRAVLQFGDGIGRPHMVFAAAAPSVFAARVQHGGQDGVVAEGRLVHADGFLSDLENTNALHTRGRASEVFVHRLGVDANRFKQLRAAVRHIGRHAHLGHDFGQAFANRLHIVVNRFVSRQVTR